MISRRFLKNSFIYTIIGAFPLASGLILSFLYINYLGRELVSIWVLYSSITMLIQILLSFFSINVFYYDYKNTTLKLSNYVSSMNTNLLISGFILIILILIAGEHIFNFIPPAAHINFHFIAGASILSAIFYSSFKSYCNLLIYQDQSEVFLKLNVLNFITTIFFSLIGLYLYPNSLIGPLGGRLLGNFVVFISCQYYTLKLYGFHWKKDVTMKTMGLNISLIFIALFGWVSSYLDRFVINGYMDIGNVAIYDFAIKLTGGFELIITGLGNTIIPKIFAIWNNSNGNFSTKEVNRYHNSIIALIIILICIHLLTIPIAVPLFIKKDIYYQAFYYLPLILISFIFRTIAGIYQLPFSFIKNKSIIPKVTIISTLIQVVLSFWWVNQFGLAGIVWALLTSKIIYTGYMIYESKKYFELSFNYLKIIILPTIFSLVIIAVYTIPGINKYYIHMFISFITFSILYMIYKKEILSLKLLFIKS